MRPLRDRIAEALRRCRVGEVRPAFVDLPEHTREDYRRSADRLLAIGLAELDFTISDTRDPAPLFSQPSQGEGR